MVGRQYTTKSSLNFGSLLPVLTALAILTSSVVAGAQSGATNEEPEKFALMIGINEYKSSPLGGCENDTAEIKKLLVEEYGFKDDSEHIKVLLSADATKQKILESFREQLVENAKKHPNAIFLFQFSGHGSQVEDTDGDESDGLDETICPVDTTLDGKGDITDDELEVLVKELTAETENATLILDCCHSGSNLRAPGFKARRLDRPALLAKTRKTRGGSGEGQDKPLLPPSKRYVAIVGCMPSELSLETEVVPGKPHGLLTYNLINTLRNGSKNLTYRDIWSRVASAVNKTASSQNPQIEGDLDRTFLKGAGDRSDSFFNVKNVQTDKDGKISIDIDAGTVFGIEQGGLVALFKKDASQLSGNENLITLGDVTVTDTFSSTVALRDTPGDDVVLEEAKVVLVTPFFGKRKLSVAIDTKAMKKRNGFLGRLKESLENNKCFVLRNSDSTIASQTPADSSADVTIVSGKGDDFVKYGGNLSATETELKSKEGFYVASAEGSPLFNMFVPADSPNCEKTITEALEKKARQQSLLNFNNNVTTLNDALALSIERVVSEKRRPGGRSIYEYETKEVDNLSTPTFKIGEKFRLSIQNKSASDLYITGVCIGVDGSIQIVFPPEGANDILPAGGKFETKPIKISGPSGIETLKLLVSTKPVDFRAIQQPAATVKVYLDALKKGEFEGVKDMLLISMFKPESARTLSSVDESLDDWVATRIDYRIQDAKSQ